MKRPEHWGEPWADANKVHQAMYRLRGRLGVPTESRFLVGRRGHGYGLFPKTLIAEVASAELVYERPEGP
jgi:hypothetical protein